MLTADRFLVQSRHRAQWLAAREGGITATTVAEAATPSGFQTVVEQRGLITEQNAYMQFGSEAEADLMRFVHAEFGILDNDWLIRGDNPRDLATPDGLSLDHREIAECKTTGKDWKTVPIKYRRQVMWQLHVTGAERALVAWNLRIPDDHGWFYLGWLDPKTVWLDRDDDMIRDLIETADRLAIALENK